MEIGQCRSKSRFGSVSLNATEEMSFLEKSPHSQRRRKKAFAKNSGARTRVQGRFLGYLSILQLRLPLSLRQLRLHIKSFERDNNNVDPFPIHIFQLSPIHLLFTLLGTEAKSLNINRRQKLGTFNDIQNDIKLYLFIKRFV